MATAHGQLVGRPAEPHAFYSPEQRRFLDGVTRSFRVPARLNTDPRWGCNAFKPDSAACLNAPEPASRPATGTVEDKIGLGKYIFVPYLPLGLAGRLAGQTTAALYAERAVAAALCLGLIAMALRATTTPWLRVALLVAVTPSLLFMSATVTSSGLEITAALAHGAALLALARRGERRGWWPYAISGAVLVLARPLGPAWLVLDAVLLVVLVGPRCFAALVRQQRSTALPALGMLATAMAFAAVWAAFVMPHDRASLSAARRFVEPTAGYLPELLLQSIAQFGWLDIAVPAWAEKIGWALYATVLLAGAALGRARNRLLLGLGLAAVLAVTFYLSAATQLPYGFGLQARYVMPLTVVVLLLAGWAADSAATTRLVTRLALPLGGAAAVLHWTGWIVNARRAAVSRSGPRLFLDHAQWHPPGGWMVWLALATLGSVLLASGFILAVRQSATSDA